LPRRLIRAPATASPATMSIHVDGSGTGVKFNVRVLPTSPREKTPPPKTFWKLEVLIEKSEELNPAMELAVTSVHVYGSDELKFAIPGFPLEGSIEMTEMTNGETGVDVMVNAPVTLTVE
jgi:hypothetical protein